MKKYRLIIFFLIISVSIVFSQKNAGNTGMSFLKIGVGAREMALAEVNTGFSNSPFQVFYNPAELKNINKSAIGIMHNEWLQSIKSEFLIANFSFLKMPFSFSINSTNIPDIEIRTKPGEKEGTFNAHYLSIGLATAFNISNDMNFGIGTKFLYENIYSNEASGYAFDIGLNYKNVLNFINFSLSTLNLGAMSKLLNESSKLPTELRIGLGLSEQLKYSDFSLAPAIYLQKYFNNDGIQFLMGVETKYQDLISLRLGYRTNKELNGFSAGLGISYYGISLDYAFIPFNNNFGTANIFSAFISL